MSKIKKEELNNLELAYTQEKITITELNFMRGLILKGEWLKPKFSPIVSQIMLKIE